MNCFYHPKKSAVGICKHCQRGLCIDCAALNERFPQTIDAQSNPPSRRGPRRIVQPRPGQRPPLFVLGFFVGHLASF